MRVARGLVGLLDRAPGPAMILYNVQVVFCKRHQSEIEARECSREEVENDEHDPREKGRRLRPARRRQRWRAWRVDACGVRVHASRLPPPDVAGV